VGETVYRYSEQYFLNAANTSSDLPGMGAVAKAVGKFSGCSIQRWCITLFFSSTYASDLRDCSSLVCNIKRFRTMCLRRLSRKR
jgi:hypothetical protein